MSKLVVFALGVAAGVLLMREQRTLLRGVRHAAPWWFRRQGDKPTG